MTWKALYAILAVTGQFGGGESETTPPSHDQELQIPSLPSFDGQPSTAQPSPATRAGDAVFTTPRKSVQGSVYGGDPPKASFVSPRSSPASLQTPIVPISREGLASPSTLIRQCLTVSGGHALQGEPTSLRAAIERVAGTPQRSDAVAAYWRLAHAMADYYLSVEETAFLLDLPNPQLPHQQARLTSARASAKARQAKARLTAVVSQHDLADIAQMASDTALPLASDTPFVGVYRTHFETLRERGVAPDHLRRIDQTLPVMHELIEQQAQAVFATAEAVTELRNAYEASQATLATVLESHRDLRNQRRQFLTIVREYDEQIAKYALGIRIPGLTQDRLVEMLIDTPAADRSVLASKKSGSRIKRVSNEEPIEPVPQTLLPLRE